MSDGVSEGYKAAREWDAVPIEVKDKLLKKRLHGLLDTWYYEIFSLGYDAGARDAKRHICREHVSGGKGTKRRADSKEGN